MTYFGYPLYIHGFNTKIDGVDNVMAAHVNDLQTEVIAIETNLGTAIAGTVEGTLNARLTTLISLHTLEDLPQNTTPSVAAGNLFAEHNNNPTSITRFFDGVHGQKITIVFETNNTTIVAGFYIKLAGGVNFVGTMYDTLVLICSESIWHEVSRSVNA